MAVNWFIKPDSYWKLFRMRHDLDGRRKETKTENNWGPDKFPPFLILPEDNPWETVELVKKVWNLNLK